VNLHDLQSAIYLMNFMIRDHLFNNNINLFKFIHTSHKDNLISCLNHPKACVLWEIYGRQYYQIFNTTNREYTSYFIAELNTKVTMQNYKINIPEYNKFYMSTFSYLVEATGQCDLSHLIKNAKTSTGIFSLSGVELTPSTILSEMVNWEANKMPNHHKTQFINHIINNRIVQHKTTI